MEPSVVVRVPGRVNLVGDHTDYNDGFALPAAIDLGLTVTARPRSDSVVRALSATQPEPAVVDPDERSDPSGWARYVAGAVAVLRAEGVAVQGADIDIVGDLPSGRGLSSSAALVLGLLVAIADLAGAVIGRDRLARLGQRVEHEWAGVQCGLMDFHAILSGARDHAVLVDCRTDAVTLVPIPDSTALLVLDPGQQRQLDTSAYNERRSECEQAVELLRRHRPEITALRDVTLADLDSGQLAGVLLRRARHVVTENARVLAARTALEAGDLTSVGRLLAESHASLRDDFEVSTPALDAVVEAAAATPGVHGARLTGAGFGGCAIALVDRDEATAAAAGILERHRANVGNDITVHVCRAQPGWARPARHALG